MPLSSLLSFDIFDRNKKINSGIDTCVVVDNMSNNNNNTVDGVMMTSSSTSSPNFVAENLTTKAFSSSSLPSNQRDRLQMIRNWPDSQKRLVFLVAESLPLIVIAFGTYRIVRRINGIVYRSRPIRVNNISRNDNSENAGGTMKKINNNSNENGGPRNGSSNENGGTRNGGSNENGGTRNGSSNENGGTRNGSSNENVGGTAADGEGVHVDVGVNWREQDIVALSVKNRYQNTILWPSIIHSMIAIAAYRYLTDRFVLPSILFPELEALDARESFVWNCFKQMLIGCVAGIGLVVPLTMITNRLLMQKTMSASAFTLRQQLGDWISMHPKGRGYRQPLLWAFIYVFVSSYSYNAMWSIGDQTIYRLVSQELERQYYAIQSNS